MSKLIKTDNEYKEWIGELKQRIRQSQIKAAVKVNTELLRLYWSIGRDIVRLKAEAKWGTNIMSQISLDLKEEFSNLGGFSETNLRYIKRFYLFYGQNQPQVGAKIKSKKQEVIQPQVEAEILEAIFNIPWGHQKHIITKAKSTNEALFYVQKTIKQGWSRNILINYMSANLFETEGKAISNFKNTLPALQSDLAQQTLKDPYNFDFLTLRDSYLERELEDALTDNITKFLIELGNGFAYVGRQVRLEIGGDEFFIDLLFYHLKLRSYVVIELKVTEFKVEYISQVQKYMNYIDKNIKEMSNNNTMGILICKRENKFVIEYCSDDRIAVREYELV